MKIAILGTRGIPNNYGGFEQFAEYLAKHLVINGHSVYVYNSHNHPYQDQSWYNVNILHVYDPEDKIGTTGQFLYDLKCILDSRKRNFDVILQLGYTSSSIWGKLLPKSSIIITNMDGLEWKRSKYSSPVRMFLQRAEKWAIKRSDYLISDSLGIKEYLRKKYDVETEFIPYGAHIFNTPKFSLVLEQLDYLAEYKYDMLIARLEPENNIEKILEGKRKSKGNKPLLVVGNFHTRFGNYLVKKFENDDRIKFLGSIYDIELLNNLRYFSNIYFHGHSVGGTNPSLLEAMASSSFICAHDNIFNKSILNKDAIYFSNEHEVCEYIEKFSKSDFVDEIRENILKIEKFYNWNLIVQKYENFFKFAFEESKKKV